MPQLNIVRRWGNHQPGDSVDIDDAQQARWLLNNHFATYPNQPESATQGAAAPGTDGPDLLAGGDHTRRRPATRKAEYGPNRALPIPGAPVQYNAGIAPGASVGSGEGPEGGQAPEPSSKVSGSGRRRKAD